MAITLAKNTLASDTNKLLKNDSMNTDCPKKLAKCPKVRLPVSVTKAV